MNKLRDLAAHLGLLVRDDTTPGEEFAGDVRPPARGIDADRVALTLDAVYRAVLVLQTSGSQLTLDAWRGPTPLPERPVILARPDVFGTLPAFLGETISSLACRGNAYWRHRLNSTGDVTGVHVLDPLTVTPLGEGRYAVAGKETRHVSHLQLLRRPGQLEGLGPIQACAETVRGAVDLRRWADKWLDEGTVPTGVLTSDQQLDANTAKRYKTQFKESVKPKDGVVVLGSGLAYSPLALKPAEMQFLESQAANVTSMARMFGIPARLMLAEVPSGSETYTNLEAETLSYVRFTLMWYLNEIETAFTELLPRGQVAKFNVDGLLRADTKTRYEAHKIGLDAGFLDLAEVRRIEGLTPKGTAA